MPPLEITYCIALCGQPPKTPQSVSSQSTRNSSERDVRFFVAKAVIPSMFPVVEKDQQVPADPYELFLEMEFPRGKKKKKEHTWFFTGVTTDSFRQSHEAGASLSMKLIFLFASSSATGAGRPAPRHIRIVLAKSYPWVWEKEARRSRRRRKKNNIPMLSCLQTL